MEYYDTSKETHYLPSALEFNSMAYWNKNYYAWHAGDSWEGKWKAMLTRNNIRSKNFDLIIKRWIFSVFMFPTSKSMNKVAQGNLQDFS